MTDAERDEMRKAELERIDRMRSALDSKCAEGNARAIEVHSKLLERRGALCGHPQRTEVTVLTEDAIERVLEQARAELKRMEADA